ncbi:MAG: hypothetical protein O3C34_15585, partial [Proteobacteria bacterium]|nr:hypothetical protein [Pseudomonadota bacterium]
QTYRIMQWLNSVPTSQSDRLLEAALAILQTDVAALNSGQAANMAAIAASASEIAANAAAIAANAAATANNTAAIGVLDGRVTTNAATGANNSTAIGLLNGRVTANATASANNGAAITVIDGRVSTNTAGVSSLVASLNSLDMRISALEQGGGTGGGIPVYSEASQLPTDGSVKLAFFQPDGGIVGQFHGNVIANQWLMVFDGVSYMSGYRDWFDGNGNYHLIPVGWHPAASGASILEGSVSGYGVIALEETVNFLLYGNQFPFPELDDVSIGERLSNLAHKLIEFIYPDGGGPATP